MDCLRNRQTQRRGERYEGEERKTTVRYRLKGSYGERLGTGEPGDEGKYSSTEIQICIHVLQTQIQNWLIEQLDD